MARAGFIDVGISATYRDHAHQDWLFGQGRPSARPHGRPGPIVTNARGGQSIHNYRLAFDFFRNVPGKAFADSTAEERAFWDTGGRLWREMGGTWGGSWRGFPDRPHCEFTGGPGAAGGLSLAQLQSGQRLPEGALMPWEEEMRFNTVKEVPAWARDFVQGMVDRGELSGDGRGLNITEDMIRGWIIGELRLLHLLQEKGLV
jgi:peptidoglycan L-alanyl-D-glutamate endopeptidase CwlK